MHRIVTSFVFYYSLTLYLYEPDLDHWVVELEFYLYMFIVWVFFSMLRVAYQRDFDTFYLSDTPIDEPPIDGPGPVETEEVEAEDEVEGEDGEDGEENSETGTAEEAAIRL